MALTPETLARHELCGLHVRVADAENPALVGIEGRVVSETERTLSVETETGAGVVERQVPKTSATFEFVLADERIAATDTAPTDPDDGDEAVYVTVDGERLVANPARRTETTGDSTWR